LAIAVTDSTFQADGSPKWSQSLNQSSSLLRLNKAASFHLDKSSFAGSSGEERHITPTKALTVVETNEVIIIDTDFVRMDTPIIHSHTKIELQDVSVTDCSTGSTEVFLDTPGGFSLKGVQLSGCPVVGGEEIKKAPSVNGLTAATASEQDTFELINGTIDVASPGWIRLYFVISPGAVTVEDLLAIENFHSSVVPAAKSILDVPEGGASFVFGDHLSLSTTQWLDPSTSSFRNFEDEYPEETEMNTYLLILDGSGTTVVINGNQVASLALFSSIAYESDLTTEITLPSYRSGGGRSTLYGPPVPITPAGWTFASSFKARQFSHINIVHSVYRSGAHYGGQVYSPTNQFRVWCGGSYDTHALATNTYWPNVDTVVNFVSRYDAANQIVHFTVLSPDGSIIFTRSKSCSMEEGAEIRTMNGDDPARDVLRHDIYTSFIEDEKLAQLFK
jgi:hypothetical protein